MDYRALLTIPLAALALSASSADGLRQPVGWVSGRTYSMPPEATHEMGVAPETENSGQRALTIKALGERKVHDIGSISQFVAGYAGVRVRFSAQVKTAGVDQWAGLVAGPDLIPFFAQPASPEADKEATAPRGAAGCPEWCDVSVVADIPTQTGGRGFQGLVEAERDAEALRVTDSAPQLVAEVRTRQAATNRTLHEATPHGLPHPPPRPARRDRAQRRRRHADAHARRLA